MSAPVRVCIRLVGEYVVGDAVPGVVNSRSRNRHLNISQPMRRAINFGLKQVVASHPNSLLSPAWSDTDRFTSCIAGVGANERQFCMSVSIWISLLDDSRGVRGRSGSWYERRPIVSATRCCLDPMSLEGADRSGNAKVVR